MCGVVAHFSRAGQTGDREMVAQLAGKLAHRGPDGRGVTSSGRVAAAHTRLAIIDVASGQQPMCADASGSVLVCNGEIYNHVELGGQLETNHTFKSQSDSEAVLHLYDELGADCAARLDGMFAFFASNGDSFVAARDPFGIKPLYWGRTKDGGLVFGSELKVDPRLKLWSHGVLEKRLLREAFADRLPQSILARPKLEFATGSGAESGLQAYATVQISDRDLLNAGHKFPVDTPKTKEEQELLYREIFAEMFPGDAWRATVARWHPEAISPNPLLTRR